MITYVTGSLFTSPAQVLVNTVNIEGVMGKGIALQFKRAFPEMFAEYQRLCESGEIAIGKLWLYTGSSNKWILNFPTKRSWRQPSRLDYVEAGLRKFVEEFDQLKIYSVAFPALGCGNGELTWEDVKPLMEEYLQRVPADIFVYPPMAADEVPEHKDPKAMAEWLRSEPRVLAFSEVWRDLQRLLTEKSDFSTGLKAYTAKILDRNLIVTTEWRDYKIEYDDLRELWSRFRSYGYLRRGIVSKPIEKVFYYIMPIFAELSYVERVELSESANLTVHGAKPSRSLGALQYIPPVESSVRQPTLF